MSKKETFEYGGERATVSWNGKLIAPYVESSNKAYVMLGEHAFHRIDNVSDVSHLMNYTYNVWPFCCL